MERLAVLLRQQRQNCGYDVRTLVSRCGVTNAQISRIENDKSQISMAALVRLAFGLDLQLKDVLSDSPIDQACLKYLSTQKSRLPSGECIPTASEILAFVNYRREQPGEIEGLLMDGLSGIPDPMPFPQTEDYLDRVYAAGGVITLDELAQFLRITRKKSGKSLRDISSERLSYVTIGRFENGGMHRLLFSQVLELEGILGLEGRLLAYVWEAEEYETGIALHKVNSRWDWMAGWNSAEKAAADAFITVCRRYHIQGDDQGWWQKVQQVLAGY